MSKTKSRELFVHESNTNSNRDSMIYPKPDIICNIELVSSSLSSLQHMYDYVIIPMSCWSYLSAWYDYDFKITKDFSTATISSAKYSLVRDSDDNEGVIITRNPTYYCKAEV